MLWIKTSSTGLLLTSILMLIGGCSVGDFFKTILVVFALLLPNSGGVKTLTIDTTGASVNLGGGQSVIIPEGTFSVATEVSFSVAPTSIQLHEDFTPLGQSVSIEFSLSNLNFQNASNNAFVFSFPAANVEGVVSVVTVTSSNTSSAISKKPSISNGIASISLTVGLA